MIDTASGKSLFPAYAIKSFKTSNGSTVRVAFIGMTLKDTPSIVTPIGVAGLSFNDEVQTVNAVDVVVSDHTHTGYTCALPNNSAGRLIPVTQGGNYGRVLTNIDLSIDNTSGDVTDYSFHNTVVDRTNAAITPDATIKSIVDAYNTNISPVAN